jgi:hypothetical protein
MKVACGQEFLLPRGEPGVRHASVGKSLRGVYGSVLSAASRFLGTVRRKGLLLLRNPLPTNIGGGEQTHRCGRRYG